MTCKPFITPGGGRGFLCSRTGPRRCACGRPATLQCDAPSQRRTAPAAGTCDKHLCGICATEVGPDRHFCPGHAAALPPQACRPLNGIPATLFHCEGAYARCSCCGRYTLDSRALLDRPYPCACGDATAWSGSFTRPGANAKWHAGPQADDHSRDKGTLRSRNQDDLPRLVKPR